MQNDVNNETEASTTGETPVVDTNKQEQPAAAQAPVAATEDAGAAAAQEAAPSTQTEQVAPQRTEPRRVAKPPAPPIDEVVEEKSGEIDFGAILEQFEQEQTVYHAGDL